MLSSCQNHEHDGAEVLGVPAAARLLGLSTATLRRLARAGLVPARAIRGPRRTHWLFSRKALLDWAAGEGATKEADRDAT